MAKLHKRYVITTAVISLLFLVYIFRNDQHSKFRKHRPLLNFSAVEDPGKRELKGRFKRLGQRQTKTILLWTTHFYSQVWKGLLPSTLDDYIEEAKCRIQECRITYDKRAIKTADVVVFHGVDFTYKNYTSEHFHALTRTVRPRHQRWLFWMHETPIYYPENENYDRLFNWTMTFSRQSSIYHPYYSYTRLQADDEPPSRYVNYAANKDKKVYFSFSSLLL